MASTSSSSSLSPPPAEKPAAQYSKRKRGEEPSPPATPPAKKRETTTSASLQNFGGKRLPKSGKGKAAAGLPARIPRVEPEPCAPYPSPFADMGTWWLPSGTLEHMTDAFAVIGTIGRPRYDWDSEAAFVVFYRHVNADAETYIEYGDMCTRPIAGITWVGQYGQVSWEDQISVAKPIKRGRANPPRARRALEFFREGDMESEKFFVVWGAASGIKVNGREVLPESESAAEVAIGPLPSFAIIEVEKTTIFWFRDQAALDYVTADVELQRLVDEYEPQETEVTTEKPGEVHEETGEGRLEKELEETLKEILRKEAEGPSPEEESRETREEEEEKRRRYDAWKRIMEEGMIRHHREHERDMNKESFYRIQAHSNLEGIDVVLAIGSVWDALRKINRHFAFSDWVGFSMARMAPGTEVPRAVNGPHDFLIPLILHEDLFSPEPDGTPAKPRRESKAVNERSEAPGNDQFVGEKGHILLVIVQDKQESNGFLNMVIMDSCPEYYSHERIKESIKKQLPNHGWKADLDKEPDLNLDARTVPAQQGLESCGIYTILNAWLYMLGFPGINQAQRLECSEREESPQAKEFLGQALELINLALSGHMDFRTIQGFYNYYGYCKLQDPEDAEIQFGHKQTTQMTEDILEGILSVGRSGVVNKADFSVDAVVRVMELTGGSLEEARQWLELSGGDVEGAAGLYF
ncbi:MAG: hypothetical protein Q9219_007116 [cf. Caloplaca sp. 3 TL-2023]